MSAGQAQFSNSVQVSVSMDGMADIHICGSCRSHFTSVEAFLAHKRSSCLGSLNHHDMTNILNAMPLMPLPQPGAMISLATGTQSTCSLFSSHPRKQPMKPTVQLAPSPKEVEHLPSAKGDTTPIPSSSLNNVASAVSGQEVDSVFPACNQDLPLNAKGPSNVRRKNKIENVFVKDAITDGALSKVGNKGKNLKCYDCTYDGCSFKTAYLKDIIRHRRIHTGDKPFTCSICHRCFTRKDKLQVHVRAHNGHKPFTCKLCPYAAVDGGSLKKHVRTHTKERPFKCQICSYASCNSSQLTTHLRTHTGDSPFHCRHCSAKFKISTDLKRHMRVHTGEKPFKCSMCPYASALKSNLKSHIRNNHLREKKIQCKHCSFTCCTKSQLKQHEQNHSSHSSVKCLECTDHTYHRHECTQTTDKSHRCSHCSIVAKNGNKSLSHVKKPHPKKQIQPETPAKHKEAGQTMTSNRRRPKPSAIKLKGKKPYACESCDAAFMRKDSYASHLKQHFKQVSNSSESIPLEVLHPQELASFETETSTPETSTGCSFEGTSNQNHNNNSTFTQLVTPTSCSDFEVLLNAIASQAPNNPQSVLQHGTGALNSTEYQASKSMSQSQNETTVTLSNVPRISSFTINNSNNGASLKIATQDTEHQSLPVTPGQASMCTGLSVANQQFILRQMPTLVSVHRQFSQIPEQAPSTFHSASSQQHLIPPLPVSVNVTSTVHQGFTPQFNGPPFPTNHNAGNALSSPDVASQPQPQGFRPPPPPQPTDMLNQALGQALNNSVPLLRGGNFQANVVMPCPLQTSLQMSAQPEAPHTCNSVLNVTPQYQNI